MLIPFLALQQHITNSLPTVQTVRMWNNNVNMLIGGNDSVYALPAVFVEFPDEIKWDQLGNGIQIVDPLIVKFHVIEDFYDAQDGTQDQNLEIFSLTDALRDCLQDWMPSTLTINSGGFYTKYAGTYNLPFGVFTRSKETQDKNHSNVYHFIQEYYTTWVDYARQRPVNGTTAGNLVYELDMVTEWNNTTLYTAASPVNYVWYSDGNIYKCILNTTTAYEPPTNTTYWKYIRKK